MDFMSLLKMMLQRKASDLFITAGVPPSMKTDGKIAPVSRNCLNAEQAQEIIYQIMSPAQRQDYEDSGEVNFAIETDEAGRFRVNVHRHQGQCGMVLRRIETEIPQLDSLALPDSVRELAMIRQGLVLVIGGTGVGKSTTLAAMVNHRNEFSNGHIICIEDPIEFIHKPRGCIITQREIGVDTVSYEAALSNALRQAPSLIVIGEIRSAETMRQALQFAETGHLCISTLHAANATQALERIVSMYPDEAHKQITMDLSLNLKAVIGQKLVPNKDDQAQQAICEVMLNTPLVSKHIKTGAFEQVRDVIRRSQHLSMQTFDQSLMEKYQQEQVSYETVLEYADAPSDLKIKIRMAENPPTGELSEHDGNSSILEDENQDYN